MNGQLHREDGPATITAIGDKLWYMNGQLHREDGPAIEHVSGNKAWYLNGEKISEEEHASQTTLVKPALCRCAVEAGVHVRAI
jgi:hypothetical protein